MDVSDKWTRSQLSPQVLQCLTQFSQVPSVLVMNKVSTTDPRKGSAFLQSPHRADHTPSACPPCPGRLPEAEGSSPGAHGSPHGRCGQWQEAQDKASLPLTAGLPSPQPSIEGSKHTVRGKPSENWLAPFPGDLHVVSPKPGGCENTKGQAWASVA